VGAVGVLAAAALIPMAVFAAPVAIAPAASVANAGGRIPWELSGAVWSECPMTIEIPVGYGAGWTSDTLGEWRVSFYDEQGTELTQDEVFAQFPDLVAPFQAFFDCLNRFPTTEYSDTPALNGAQRELYWGYLLSELAPCLRNHGYEVLLPSRHVFQSTDITDWYLEEVHAWDGSVPLDDLLTVWNECPIYPSYLEQPSTDGVSVVLRQAG